MAKAKLRILTQGAIICALTVIFSNIRLFRMPLGGSVTLDMIPILVFSLLWGPKKGMATGFFAGLIQALLGGYFIHPVQFALDYPLAYGALGLSGFFRNRPLLGIVVAAIARTGAHIASGMIFFISSAPENWVPWKYAIAYNLAYMIPSSIFGLFAIILYNRLKQSI